MSIGRSIILAAAQSDRLNRFATKSRIVKRATKAFMPGERPEDALDVGATLAKDGRTVLFTKLGEALTALKDADDVRDHEQFYLRSGINSVPAVIINDRHVISGGQPPEVFAQALRQIAQESVA